MIVRSIGDRHAPNWGGGVRVGIALTDQLGAMSGVCIRYEGELVPLAGRRGFDWVGRTVHARTIAHGLAGG